jgi:L-lactate dehydrogenase complex protein LldE
MSTPKVIALCVTCLVDQVMPEVGVATVRLLRRAGFSVEFPPGQTCCGQPFLNSGYPKEAARLARNTIDTFADYAAVVLPSGSCTTMIRHEYTHLFADEPKYLYRARRLASNTYELSEFLTLRQNGESSLPPPESTKTVTYHDSCHMCRTLGLREQPRKVLREAGINVQEMIESDRCCGFGGLFSVRMPEVSNAMTAAKLSQAQATGVDRVVTADPGCLMQMRGLAAEYDLEVEHLAVALEEAA